MARPIVVLSSATASPTASEMREPWMTRLYTSRPSMSVPNHESAEGGFRRNDGSVACGSALASQGARNAIRIMRISTTPPAMAVGCRRRASLKRSQVGEAEAGAGSAIVAMSVADARIEQHVRQVDREVDQHVDP